MIKIELFKKEQLVSVKGSISVNLENNKLSWKKLGFLFRARRHVFSFAEMKWDCLYASIRIDESTRIKDIVNLKKFENRALKKRFCFNSFDRGQFRIRMKTVDILFFLVIDINKNILILNSMKGLRIENFKWHSFEAQNTVKESFFILGRC